MAWMRKRFGNGSVSRPAGVLLLLLMFVLQVTAPPAAAAVSAAQPMTHAQHDGMATMSHKCPSLGATHAVEAKGAHGDMHETTAQCAMSMCCFHDTVSAYRLTAIGALLPGARTIDRGTALASSARSTQDRPPRHI